MRHFLIKLFLFAIPLVVLIPLWIFLVKESHWSNFGYLKFQVAKLLFNEGRHFNVVYIGDSSGGYALSTEGDSTSINLCLTGSFCNNGLLSFVDIVDRHISYDTIIVVNTVDLAAREVNEGAYWLPYLYSDNFLKKSIAYFYSLQYAKGIILGSIGKNHFPVSASEFIDYPTTDKKTGDTSNSFEKRIDQNQMNDLKSLNDKLRKSNVKKFSFLFGPSLPYDKIYFKELCDVIKGYQIQHVLNTPYLLTETSKGDSPDHVHPSYRDSTTAYYRRIIRSSSH
jgi:hypothetical protein